MKILAEYSGNYNRLVHNVPCVVKNTEFRRCMDRDFVKSNKDVWSIAEEWAELMEVEMKNGRSLVDVFVPTMNKVFSQHSNCKHLIRKTIDFIVDFWFYTKEFRQAFDYRDYKQIKE